MKSTESGSTKILIAYFTRTGNTQKIATKIKEIVGGEIFRIEPVEKYPTSYQETLRVSKKEIKKNYKPPLKKKVEDLEKFDTIFIGSPNWYSTIAPPVTTFLSEHNFSGKKIIPFISHGGGGKASCFTDLKIMIPEATVLDGIAIYGAHIESISEDILKSKLENK